MIMQFADDLSAQEILAHDLPVAPLVEGVQLVVFRRQVHGLPQVEARHTDARGSLWIYQTDAVGRILAEAFLHAADERVA